MPAPAIAVGIGYVLVQVARLYAVAVIGRILATIGIGLFTYKVGGPALMSWVGDQFQALPAFVRDSVAASGIDIFATMVLSALIVKKTSSVFFGSTAT